MTYLDIRPRTRALRWWSSRSKGQSEAVGMSSTMTCSICGAKPASSASARTRSPKCSGFGALENVRVASASTKRCTTGASVCRRNFRTRNSLKKGKASHTRRGSVRRTQPIVSQVSWAAMVQHNLTSSGERSAWSAGISSLILRHDGHAWSVSSQFLEKEHNAARPCTQAPVVCIELKLLHARVENIPAALKRFASDCVYAVIFGRAPTCRYHAQHDGKSSPTQHLRSTGVSPLSRPCPPGFTLVTSWSVVNLT